MEESPFRSPTWEFLMTPIITIVAGLIHFIAWTAPVGYIIAFEIRAVSEIELEEIEDDEDYFDE